ncbi:MAG: hypothetical protein ACO22R_10345, partial [Chitinophagaceae bacterium]
MATMKVFDLQSTEGNIEKLAASGELSQYNLLIAHTGATEYLQLAALSNEKNIPLINANYPNDGGIRKSPTVFIANPKINSHLNVMHNQLIKKWPDANIIWFKRNDPGDERLAAIFKELSVSSNKMKYKTVELNSSFSTDEISIHLDTNKTNVLIAGSLDELFSSQFAKAILNYTKKGIIQVIGMPNWETLKEIQSKSVLTPSKLPDADYVVNPYTGCRFGCTYCYASFMCRYAGKEINDWGEYVFVKKNAPELLKNDLKRLKNKGAGKSILFSSV